MVSLEQIRLSNSEVAASLPSNVVAVFAGATAGIGEATLKQFAKNAIKPRIYFIGRSKASGDRVLADLRQLNPEGEYIYVSVDVSVLEEVDRVCLEIKEKETAINLLFLSTGTMITGKDTKEGLHYIFAVSYYARLRFIVNFLPLLENATNLRRVVTVLAGTKEGQVYVDDLQCRHRSLFSPGARGHVTSMTTLSLEAIARKAPSVSFVHDYPGFVKTSLGSDLKGPVPTIFRAVFEAILLLIGRFIETPLDESGERHVFFATSARFPAKVNTDAAGGVALPEGLAVARGTDGQAGSGVYSIFNDGESAPPKVEHLLETLRKDGTAQKVWANVEEEFIRITGAPSM